MQVWSAAVSVKRAPANQRRTASPEFDPVSRDKLRYRMVPPERIGVDVSGVIGGADIAEWSHSRSRRARLDTFDQVGRQAEQESRWLSRFEPAAADVVCHSARAAVHEV